MANTDTKGPRIRIESDGTFEGTIVEVDGKGIGAGSKKLDSVGFMAERPFEEGGESFFRFRASTVEKDGDTERIMTTRISNENEEILAHILQTEETPKEEKDEETSEEEPKDDPKDESEEKEEEEETDETKEEDEGKKEEEETVEKDESSEDESSKESTEEEVENDEKLTKAQLRQKRVDETLKG
jgi:hypothetical protein